MGIALVVVTGDLGNHPHLFGGHQAVGHGNPQHGRKALNVQAILQAQRAKFFATELASQVTAGLITELLNAVLDDLLIVLVVYVHEGSCFQAAYSNSARTAAHP
ncbi:hypothetical protein D9M69_730730 [compost metagenome]